jgi:hypothetical protein
MALGLGGSPEYQAFTFLPLYRDCTSWHHLSQSSQALARFVEFFALSELLILGCACNHVLLARAVSQRAWLLCRRIWVSGPTHGIDLKPCLLCSWPYSAPICLEHWHHVQQLFTRGCYSGSRFLVMSAIGLSPLCPALERFDGHTLSQSWQLVTARTAGYARKSTRPSLRPLVPLDWIMLD